MLKKAHLIFVAVALVVLVFPSVSGAQNSAENIFWESVRNTGEASELEAYLRAYPKGRFAPLARIRLKKLKNQTASPRVPRPDVNKGRKATSKEIRGSLDLFGDVLERVRRDYIKKPDDVALIKAAIKGTLDKFSSKKAESIARDQLPKKCSGQSKSVIYGCLDVFGDVIDAQRQDHPGKSFELIKAAMNGMLRSLDPYSNFLSAQGLRQRQAARSGKFGGIGIEVTMVHGIVKIVTPIDNTPAHRAGVKAGDLVTQLDGKAVSGLTLGQAVDKMRGRVGSSLTLTIVRKGFENPFDIKVTRDIIKMIQVSWRAEEDIGYIRIAEFSELTQSSLVNAISRLNEKIGLKLKGYVIDLRNNPGGLLDHAISVSDTFLEKGMIVMVLGRDAGKIERSAARSGDLAGGKKIVVLINRGSASGSEIVAGALQDHRRATIIGTRSFGKGYIQTITSLGGKGALRLTSHQFYRPSGKKIEGNGIVPDIIVEQKNGAIGKSKDAQLKAALDFLNGQPGPSLQDDFGDLDDLGTLD